MADVNRLRLAVAGGRKTQGIVEACVASDRPHRELVLTYTLANQRELERRLASDLRAGASVEVTGWFSFLMSSIVRPYLPCFAPNRRLSGLNFDGDPGRFQTGIARYLDTEDRAYKRHLAKLATEVVEVSAGAVMDRLTRIYDRIWIDEVQDLNGYDLDILELLMDNGPSLELVGDVRQAILDTNVQSPRLKQFRGVAMKRWFDQQEKADKLVIEHASTTWRCCPEIAAFADSIFDESYGFAATRSENRDQDSATTGIYAVASQDREAFVRAHRPLCLRHSSASGRSVDLPFLNIGLAKGREADHVLVFPTGPMRLFLEKNKPLEPGPAASLYVAVTRAREGVAFLLDDPGACSLPRWEPQTGS